MRILLVADDIDDSVAVGASLAAGGHAVASCNDEFGGPCRGIDHLQDCPLEGHVDLAVIARSGNVRRGLGEMGSVCAARHRVGAVEIDPSQPPDETLESMAIRAEQAMCHGYERAILTGLRDAGGDNGIYVTVRRQGGTVLVTLALDAARSVDMNDRAVAGLADRARDTTRRHDRFARSIDVSVLRSAISPSDGEALVGRPS